MVNYVTTRPVNRQLIYEYIFYQNVVQSLVVENNGTSFASASSCYFDEKTDGAITARWSDDDFIVMVSVFCLALPGEDN